MLNLLRSARRCNHSFMRVSILHNENKCSFSYKSILPSSNTIKKIKSKNDCKNTFLTSTPSCSSSRYVDDGKILNPNFLSWSRLSSRSITSTSCVIEGEKVALSEVESLKVFQDENIIQLNFSDGKVINFNLLWLRDSCQCPQCVHEITKQKLLNCADIQHDLIVSNIKCDHQVVQIIWRNQEGDEHTSHYQLNWLKKFEGVFAEGKVATSINDGIYAPKLGLIKETYWDAKTLADTHFKVKYSDLITKETSLKKVVELICHLGIAFITDVPLNRDQILIVARRIAYEKITGYGVTFDVTFNPAPNTHLSYTGTKFEPHIDLAYRERSPGIQMLHCLEQASKGGESVYVDGFACARLLKESDEEAFEVLNQVKPIFSFYDSERDIWFRENWPIIASNSDGTIKEMHVSDFSMRPPLIELQKLPQFYHAYSQLTKIIRSHAMQHRFFMQPGELIIFNNRRVLHGRDEYDHNNERRFLKGCYMDLDEVKQLYEKLHAKEQNNKL